MSYQYCEIGKPASWVDCELLHEFLYSYQIKYKDPYTGIEVEKVVKREEVKEKRLK